MRGACSTRTKRWPAVPLGPAQPTNKKLNKGNRYKLHYLQNECLKYLSVYLIGIT